MPDDPGTDEIRTMRAPVSDVAIVAETPLALAPTFAALIASRIFASESVGETTIFRPLTMKLPPIPS